MLIKKKIDEPYNKKPGDEPLPILSKTTIKSKLTKKFWKITEHIYNQKLPSNQALPQEKNVEKNNIKIINNINKKNNQSGNTNINNKSNNKNNIRLKSKRVKTPTMKHNNIINMDKNKNGQYNNNKNNVSKSKYQNELNKLREKAINLEEELEKSKKIVEYQEKENNELMQRIEKLTIKLKSIIPMDNI